VTEKKDFYAKSKGFDDLARQATAKLDHLQYGEPMIELLKHLVAHKAKSQDAAETMFIDCETKKAHVPPRCHEVRNGLG
jgi:hypothetical protein